MEMHEKDESIFELEVTIDEKNKKLEVVDEIIEKKRREMEKQFKEEKEIIEEECERQIK